MIKPLVAAAAALLLPATAGADGSFAPVRSSLVARECGACHMAFPPEMLPGRSWSAVIDGLAEHFGTDADLPAGAREAVRAYLNSAAGDVSGSRVGAKFVGSIAPGSAPLRISEVPRWAREHRKVAPSTWARADVGSKSNCQACHPGADRGDFGD